MPEGKLAFELEELRGLGQAGYPDYDGVLKRNLFIPNVLIFDSRVWRGMPRFAAAPFGPPTWPWASANADSIASRSLASRDVARATVVPEGCGLSVLSQVSSTLNVLPSHKITPRSTTFWSSRMLPGHP